MCIALKASMRHVFKWTLNEKIEEDNQISDGKQFHNWGAVTKKALYIFSSQESLLYGSVPPHVL